MLSMRHGVNALALVSLSLASGCTAMPSTQSPDSAPTQDAAGATVATPESAAQLAARWLALVEHTRTPADLSPDQVERHTGLRMRPRSDDPSQLEATGRLAGRWNFSMTTVRSSYRVVPYALRLRLDNGRDGASDMSLVCEFDYTQYKASLERLGFEPRVILGSQRQINFNHDSGSGLHVIVYVRAESAKNEERRCVDMALIDFMPGSPAAPHSP